MASDDTRHNGGAKNFWNSVKSIARNVVGIDDDRGYVTQDEAAQDNYNAMQHSINMAKRANRDYAKQGKTPADNTRVTPKK